MKKIYLYPFLLYGHCLYFCEFLFFQYLSNVDIWSERTTITLTLLLFYMTLIGFILFPRDVLMKKPQTKKEWIIFAIKNAFFQLHSFNVFNRDYIFPFFRRQIQNFKNFVKYWAELPDE